MKMLLLALPLLSAGCTAAVYNPTKTKADMRADIRMCEREANRHHYWDRVAALKIAYECLETQGYSRGQPQFVEEGRSPEEGERRRPEPGQPCRVPC